MLILTLSTAVRGFTVASGFTTVRGFTAATRPSAFTVNKPIHYHVAMDLQKADGVLSAQELDTTAARAAALTKGVVSPTKGVVSPTRSGDVSPAADNVHRLGELAGSAMPLTYAVDDPALDKAHSFSRSASWLIPEYVLCGSYPGPSPGQPNDKCACILEAGVTTFVCLQ